MNPNEATVEESRADQLRSETQINDYTKQEQDRLQKNKLAKLSRFKKNRGGPADPRLSFATIFLMLGVAVFFDIISFIMNFIPFIGGFLQDFTLEPIAIITFFLWLKMKGVKFTQGYTGLLSVIVVIIGFIPLLNAIPEWTSYITGIYFSNTKFFKSAQGALKKPAGK